MTTRLDEAYEAAARGLATETQLARIVADHCGWRGVASGWVVNGDGQGVGKGWGAVGRVLSRRQMIVRNARGQYVIDWARVPSPDSLSATG